MSTLLEGNLAAISLANLVQLIALEQKDAKLGMQRVELGQRAELYFRRGELIHAEVNGIRGDRAMLRIINWWNAGNFVLTAVSPEALPEKTVTMRMDYLLLEGMRQMDAGAPVRALLPQLTSAMSFTQAALDAFRWDQADPAEWIPHDVRRLPRSFSVSQLHQVCDHDEPGMTALLRMLLATQALRVHTGAPEPQADGFTAPQTSTRYEAFAQLIMEYVSYEQAYALLDGVIADAGGDSLDGMSFSQLLDLADRLGMTLAQHLDRKKAQDAIRRLRARVTSLL